MKMLIWTNAATTTKCGACKTAMAVERNEVYYFRDGNPIHEKHATPAEQEQLKAERAQRQGDTGERLAASRKKALATAATAAQWVCAKASANRERRQ